MPLYGRNLVSDDFRGAAINIFFRDMTDAEYAALGVDDKIRALLHQNRGPEEFYFTGAAHVKQAAVELMRQDLTRFTPIALGLKENSKLANISKSSTHKTKPTLPG